jgi:hypothetical protein
MWCCGEYLIPRERKRRDAGKDCIMNRSISVAPFTKYYYGDQIKED